MSLLRAFFLGMIVAPAGFAAQTDIAALAINTLGLDLHRQLTASDDNTCLSPYSIQTALAMTFSGASGVTRTEMTRALHFPADETALHASFGVLLDEFAAMQTNSAAQARYSNEHGGTMEPIVLCTANRLFGQQGFQFRAPFLSLLQDRYHAQLETLDFVHAAFDATDRINSWVAEQTRDRIRDVVPAGALGPDTRLALVNAVYLKAPWLNPFYPPATKPQPFYARSGAPANVPMMCLQHHFGYRKFDGFSAVTLPYVGGALHFLVLVPDARGGLAALEAQLTPNLLQECASLPTHDVVLYMPKLKLEPPTMPLSALLQHLGMKAAFDQPRGSADFDQMAPRLPDSYLCISEVFHKTFLRLDEEGTEAAAATAAAVTLGAMRLKPEVPIEVRVDRPFFYAIQHAASGACLFVGRVVDPR